MAISQSYNELKKDPFSGWGLKNKKQNEAYLKALGREVENAGINPEALQFIYDEVAMRHKALGRSMREANNVFEDKLKNIHLGGDKETYNLMEKLKSQAPDMSHFTPDNYSRTYSARKKEYRKNMSDLVSIIEINKMNPTQLIDKYKTTLTNSLNSGIAPNQKIVKAMNVRKHNLLNGEQYLSSKDYQKLSFDVSGYYDNRKGKRNEQIKEDLEIIEFSEQNPGMYPGKGQEAKYKRENIISSNLYKTQEGTKLHAFLTKEQRRLEKEKSSTSGMEY